jgi:hypothetical protein
MTKRSAAVAATLLLLLPSLPAHASSPSAGPGTSVKRAFTKRVLRTAGALSYLTLLGYAHEAGQVGALEQEIQRNETPELEALNRRLEAMPGYEARRMAIARHLESQVLHRVFERKDAGENLAYLSPNGRETLDAFSRELEDAAVLASSEQTTAQALKDAIRSIEGRLGSVEGRLVVIEGDRVRIPLHFDRPTLLASLRSLQVLEGVSTHALNLTALAAAAQSQAIATHEPGPGANASYVSWDALLNRPFAKDWGGLHLDIGVRSAAEYAFMLREIAALAVEQGVSGYGQHDIQSAEVLGRELNETVHAADTTLAGLRAALAARGSD